VSELDRRWAAVEWRRVVESRPRRERRRRLALATLFLAIVAILGGAIHERDRWSRWHPFSIQAIEISGNRAVCTAEILDIAGVRAGDPWWICRPAEIRARVAECPRIKTLRLGYGWFHRFRIAVTEREPAAALVGFGDGLITADGYLIEGAGAADTEDLPIVRPMPGAVPRAGSQVDAQTASIVRLIETIRERRLDLWREISEIEVTSDGARAYLRSQPVMILFFPGEHEELWDNIPRVLSDQRKRGATDLVLDLRFEGRIVVRTAGEAPQGGEEPGPNQRRA